MTYNYLREDGRYLHASPEELSKALSADDFTVSYEEDVYELLLDWVYYDLERRKQYFGLLFESLRLAYIPAPYVEKIIKKEELVQDSPPSYGAVVQFEKLAAQLKKGVSASTRSNYERVAGGPRDNYRDYSILVCGGKGTEQRCLMYTPSTNGWRKLDDLKLGRSNAAAFATDDAVCLIGGEDTVRNTIMKNAVYDVGGLRWTDGIPAPGQVRTGGRCATLAGKTYLIGGITTDEGYSNSVERYNPECKRWVPVKSMEYKRFSFGCTTASDGFIYACGGFDGERDLKECEFFMPDANEWTMISAMNVARSGCKTVSAEGKLYTLGGWDGTKILNSCEMYDPRSNRWTMIQPMNRPRHGLEVVVIGNVIYAIGGWNGSKKLSSIERYHCRSHTWELLKPMSEGGWLMTAITVPTPPAVPTPSAVPTPAAVPTPSAVPTTVVLTPSASTTGFLDATTSQATSVAS